jgi:hypothetical protein
MVLSRKKWWRGSNWSQLIPLHDPGVELQGCSCPRAEIWMRRLWNKTRKLPWVNWLADTQPRKLPTSLLIQKLIALSSSPPSSACNNIKHEYYSGSKGKRSNMSPYDPDFGKKVKNHLYSQKQIKCSNQTTIEYTTSRYLQQRRNCIYWHVYVDARVSTGWSITFKYLRT